MQTDLRLVAEFPPRLVDRMPVVGAEELHAEPGQERLALRVGHPREPLGRVARAVKGAVRDMQAGRLGTDLVGNIEPLKTVADATTQIVNAPVCATDAGGQVQVIRSGFGYNFATQRFVQTVTLKNLSASILAGPLSLVLDNLSSNATLFSPSGTTACAAPAGSPFINSSGNLNPGASVSVTLQFMNPSRAGITYATRVLAGSAGR